MSRRVSSAPNTKKPTSRFPFARTSKLSHQPRAIYITYCRAAVSPFPSSDPFRAGQQARVKIRVTEKKIVQELNFQFMSDSKSDSVSKSVNCCVEWHERSRQPNRDVDPAGRWSHALAHSTRPCQCTESGYTPISRQAFPVWHRRVQSRAGPAYSRSAVRSKKKKRTRKDLPPTTRTSPSERGGAAASHLYPIHAITTPTSTTYYIALKFKVGSEMRIHLVSKTDLSPSPSGPTRKT